MITIGNILYKENDYTARIEANIKTDGHNDFLLYFEVEKVWGRYLVTDRADAFLVGILNQAMLKGHDIRCESPVSSELKIMLEQQLIHTLAKHDKNLYPTKIHTNLTQKPLENAGAVGTGISLGLDSFTTIAQSYNSASNRLKLSHLLTFFNMVGGFYKKANWDYCAEKLYEKEKKVAYELGLPLIAVNTNLPKFMHPRVDYYWAYMLIMAAMALGKLFGTYYISSWGLDFSHFNICNTALQDCGTYELLLINNCSFQGGVRFLSGGGELDRLEKFRLISKFPVAKKYLQSCLTQYYNCMTCQKCKRNLVTMDALGILDDFSDVYDIQYYRAHRGEYIEWMCQQVTLKTHAAGFIIPAYNLLYSKEPELIEQHTYTQEKLFSQLNELKRQRNAYQRYAKVYRKLLTRQGWEEKLREWFRQRNLKKIILYGNGSGTLLLSGLANHLGIKISYIVEDPKRGGGGGEHLIPRLPENTINYPACDAIIICNMDKPWAIEKKLKKFVNVPVYKIGDVLELK